MAYLTGHQHQYRYRSRSSSITYVIFSTLTPAFNAAFSVINWRFIHLCPCQAMSGPSCIMHHASLPFLVKNGIQPHVAPFQRLIALLRVFLARIFLQQSCGHYGLLWRPYRQECVFKSAKGASTWHDYYPTHCSANLGETKEFSTVELTTDSDFASSCFHELRFGNWFQWCTSSALGSITISSGS